MNWIPMGDITPGDGIKRMLGDTSNAGPALWGAPGIGILYIAWTGTDGDHKLNIVAVT
jgi:hypothetical protein